MNLLRFYIGTTLYSCTYISQISRKIKTGIVIKINHPYVPKNKSFETIRFISSYFHIFLPRDLFNAIKIKKNEFCHISEGKYLKHNIKQRNLTTINRDRKS